VTIDDSGDVRDAVPSYAPAHVSTRTALQRPGEGGYPSGKSVTVVVVDAMGASPSDAAPSDIAAGAEDGTDIAAGVASIPLRFVAAEDGVSGRFAA
jgi:hypothetical protein